jgi:aminopeptidase N
MIRLLLTLAALRQPGPLTTRVANYHISVKLDAQAHTLVGQQTLEWRNDGGLPTPDLWFHLYWNAFKNDTTQMMSPPEHGIDGKKSTPSHWGAIDIDRVLCDGVEVKMEPKEDGTVARILLPQPLAANRSIKCDINWHAQMPEVIARAGYAGDFHMVTQWFPKIGVWTGREWKCHTYCANCEFFADYGVYDVDITVPDKYIVGATGVLAKSEQHGGERTDFYHAEDVHDFAWAASPAFRERIEKMDARPGLAPIEVRLLYQPQHEWFAGEHMKLLRATLRDYGDWFGEYPYSTLTAIDSPDDTDISMEYPTFIGVESPSSRVTIRSEYTKYVTIHELGHNWFYGLLANNENEEPLLDEGLNQYASDVVLERETGAAMIPGTSQAMDEREGYVMGAAEWGGFAKPAWAHSSHWHYESATYAETATFLYSLERAYGRERLMKALGVYARRYRFRHPTTLGFIATLSEALGVDVQPLAHQLMVGAVWDDEIAITAARRQKPTSPWRSEVVVHRKGTHVHAVDVRVRFDDGSEVTEHWDGQTRWHSFVYERKQKVTEATVDPATAWLLDVNLLNNGMRREPARLPSRRMAAGAGFWLQTLWQVLGL